MKQNVPRWVTSRLQQLLRVMPVAVVTGPRQTGKTTLARTLAPEGRFLSLDDFSLLEQARREPRALLAERPVTVDEVQYCPELLRTICGLAAWLAGASGITWIDGRSDQGFWLEQAVYQTLQTWRSLEPARRRISFWRDRNGREVDFILEQDDRVVGLEIKLGSSIGESDTRGLRTWRESLPERYGTVRGVVLNTSECRTLGENLFALPWGWMMPLDV